MMIYDSIGANVTQSVAFGSTNQTTNDKCELIYCKSTYNIVKNKKNEIFKQKKVK